MGMFAKPGAGAVSPAVKPKSDPAPRKQAAAGPAPMGIFKNVKTARPKNDGEFIKPGHYALRLDLTKADRDRKQIPYCKIEATVIAVIDDNLGHAHRVGDEVVQIFKYDSDYFDSEIQAFCAGVLGLNPEEMTEEAVEAIFCGDNPLAGFPVEMKAYNITLKDNRDFTRVKWIRLIPATEMLELDATVQERFWPGGGLRRLAEVESQQQG